MDPKPAALDWAGWYRLRKMLRQGAYDRVYDLQNNDRTAWYFRLLYGASRPEWVGAVRGASHRNASAERTKGPAFDGHVQTLALAGVTGVERDTLRWMAGEIAAFDLKSPYVLLVVGSSPAHPEKRWPETRYAALAKMLQAEGFQPVILGGQAEIHAARMIAQQCPDILDLTGQTDLNQIGVVARDAAGAVGNDTGPMHLIAATGCPSLTLFSARGNPARHAPQGACAGVLQAPDLLQLSEQDVMAAFQDMRRNCGPCAVSSIL